MPGRITRMGKIILGTAAMSGVRRAAVLGGAALATKFGGLAYVAAALPVAAIEVRRQWGRLGSGPALSSGIAAALLLAAALPTYAIAWGMTRNPIFPFLNQKLP